MALKKILPADLEGKGVKGQPDTPGLTAAQMQEKVEEIVRTVVIAAFNQNAENTYDKAEVTAAIEAKMQAIGAGDMAKATYDPNNRQEDVFALVPPGVIMPYAGANSPTGFLLCNGAAVSRNVYARLFKIIGTAFGVGDGSTTFNLPDMRGRVPVGCDANLAIGAKVGTRTHTLTVDEIPTHTHNIPIQIYSNNFGDQSISGNAAGAAKLGTTGYTGGGAAHNNMQPSIGVNYIIKV